MPSESVDVVPISRARQIRSAAEEASHAATSLGLLHRSLPLSSSSATALTFAVLDAVLGDEPVREDEVRALVGRGEFEAVDLAPALEGTDDANTVLVDPVVALMADVLAVDWSRVSLEVFGASLQQALARSDRHDLGAYYTLPSEIERIVQTAILEPWREEIARADTHRRIDELLARLAAYRVLDPACGGGSFLSVAYRALRTIEAELIEKKAVLSRSKVKQRELCFTSAGQCLGIDVDPFAVELARIVLKATHARVNPTSGCLRPQLLERSIVVADALLNERGERTVWPQADVIIGNPPYLGAKRLEPARGTEYVRRLRACYPEIPAMADYCVYWFRRAHEHIPPCTRDDRVGGWAGLVGTQNIRSGRSRDGGLDAIAATGTIVEAVDNMAWPGDANVHVSIVCWMKSQDSELIPAASRLWRQDATSGELVRRDVPRIDARLSAEADVARARPLRCNQEPKRCFQGKIPGYDGFLLTHDEACALEPDSAAVVAPYIVGRELLGEAAPRRWIIDFGRLGEEEAARCKSAFEVCRTRVLPEVRRAYDTAVRRATRMAAARKEHLGRWWQLWNRRDELSGVLRSLPRYIACSRVTRRPILEFVASSICPSDLVQVFAFDDDYSFGVLQSVFHFEWFRARASRLKIESDKRYSVRDVFETFPWPQGKEFGGPRPELVTEVAEAARDVRRTRADLLNATRGTLRSLYRDIDEPPTSRLRAAHQRLDELVAQCYGVATSEDPIEVLARLNREVEKRIEAGEQVVGPGIPGAFADRPSLSSNDAFGRRDDARTVLR
jgi:hypothetical protein